MHTSENTEQLEVFRRRLSEIQGDVDAARESASWQAVASLHRLCVQVEQAIAEELARAAEPTDPAADLSDADLVDGICTAIAGLDDATAERFELALQQRRTGRPALRVVEGE